MMRGWVLLVLGLSVSIWLFGHLTAESLPITEYPYTLLDVSSHTTASIWIRILSIPLRIVLVIALALFLNKHAYPEYEASIISFLGHIWSLLAIFYAADFALNNNLVFPEPLFYSSLILAFLWLLSLYNKNILPWLSLGALFAMGTGVITSQFQNGENNAFTILGLQGLAITLGLFSPRSQQKVLIFIVLCPALGYLFPLCEKILLNPIGWLSGSTLSKYGLLWGYSLPSGVSVFLSLLLICFQLSYVFVLYKPASGKVLYPLAIGFHLIAGVILGFSPAMNPWIVSLLIALSVLFTTKSRYLPSI